MSGAEELIARQLAFLVFGYGHADFDGVNHGSSARRFAWFFEACNGGDMLNKLSCNTAFGAALLAMSLGIGSTTASADDSELTKQLANPISSLISVPIQMNYDTNIGPDETGDRFQANVQPVIPWAINDDWNVISRTIVPITWQNDILSETSGQQYYLGDTLQSFFFSPQEAGPLGIIWGIGPALLLPTGTDPLLSQGQVGLGPTFVALKQGNGWTGGFLMNHIFGLGDHATKDTIDSTYVQPFLSYSQAGWTYSVNTELTYNWNDDQWTGPVNFQIAKLMMMGHQPVQLFGAVKYWALDADSTPHDFGARFGATFLFPN